MRRVVLCSLAGLICAGPAFAAGRAEARAGVPVLYSAVEQHGRLRWTGRAQRLTAVFDEEGVTYRAAGAALRIEYLGGSSSPRVSGEDESPTRLHFLLGSESEWRTDVRTWKRLRLREVYPGIDVVYGGSERVLKSEFIVAPGADPGQIALRYRGALSVRLAPDGSLVVETSEGTIREAPPVAWQVTAEGREAVECAYELEGEVVRFRTGQRDRGAVLVIDPEITFSSLLGGTGIESATAIDTDAAGNAYVAGYTDSGDLEVRNPLQGAKAGSADAFLARYAPDGALVYVTYLGGRYDDRALAIAAADDGTVVAAGFTTSQNFPTRLPFQTNLRGATNAFVTKLNAAGNGLVFSTYLGGSSSDQANALALDDSGRILVGGEATSANFPLQGAWQLIRKGARDGFVARFSPTGSLLFSGYLGGSLEDRVFGIAPAGPNGLWVTGGTFSADFPVRGADQPARRPAEDAFVTRIDFSPAAAITVSTYLGGSAADRALAAASTGADGGVAVAGYTSSLDLPARNAYQTASAGAQDGFVAAYDAAGVRRFSTYVGGNAADSLWAVRTSSGAIWVAGKTDSSFLGLARPVQSAKAGLTEAFLAALTPDGATMSFGTYLGGTGMDAARGLALGDDGIVWVAGQSLSTDYPATAGTGSPDGQAFVTRLNIASNVPPTAVSVAPNTGSGAAAAFTAVFDDLNGASDLAQVYGWFESGGAQAASCQWKYDAAAGRLYLLDDAGVSWGAGIAPGAAGSVANTQCSVSGGGMTVAVALRTLTLTVPVTFRAAFNGAKNVQLRAVDTAGDDSGFSSKGTWTVLVNVPPRAVSVTPPSGSGAAATLTYSATDDNGPADVRVLYGLFDTKYNTKNTCFWRLDLVRRTMTMLDDAGNYLPSIAQGSGLTLGNTQCAIESGFTIQTSGANVVVQIPFQFKTALFGKRNVYLTVEDAAKTQSPLTSLGSWTMPGAVPEFTAVSVATATAAQDLTFSFRDANGHANLAAVYGMVARRLAVAYACNWKYVPATRALYLRNDAGNQFTGPVVLGSADVLENAQCRVGGTSGSTAAVAADTLAVTVPVEFKYPGSMMLYGMAEDAEKNSGAFIQRGTWTVPGAATPQVSAVTPASGGGTTALFTYTYTDANGFLDIQSAFGLVQTGTAGARSCEWQYYRPANTLLLLNDAGNGWLGPVAFGSANTLQNSQCIVGGAGSLAVSEATTLTVSVPVTFKAAFAGARTLYGAASDYNTATSGWVAKGTWTVQ